VTSYGFLGVGSIAAAMVVGLCDGGGDAPDVVLSPRNAERSADLAGRFDTVRVAASNQAVVDDSDVVVVCLLPHDAAAVLSELRFRPGQAVVSAVAALHLSQLATAVSPATDVALITPLPAAATRSGATPVHPGIPAATALLDRLGGSLVLDDELAYEAIGTASATVASYFRYLGTIADWLTDHGIPQVQARRYVADTFAALSGELGHPEADFGALADAHATSGGLNEQLARDLTDAGVYDAVQAGLDAILARIAPN
jgi:pyrroline-5-carboxylate reductase